MRIKNKSKNMKRRKEFRREQIGNNTSSRSRDRKRYQHGKAEHPAVEIASARRVRSLPINVDSIIINPSKSIWLLMCSLKEIEYW